MSDSEPAADDIRAAHQAAERLGAVVGELGLRLYGYRVALVDVGQHQNRLAVIADFGLDGGRSHGTRWGSPAPG